MRPWASTDSPIVKYVVSRIVVAPGRLASWTTITANTIDARPRGPNQPRNATVRQFADVPATKSLDQVTKLEEDRIVGYYGAGTLYATPARQEPLL